MSVSEMIDKYGVLGNVKINEYVFPVINIPMMSNERLEEMVQENAVQNYIRVNGIDPESIDEAVQWQCERLDARERS